ncbi:MAG: helix-turn-helix domain-containing protein [Betaproteobacteria bacterium]|nr:MAG: helix-turn-helix domain-containing protein [Betaproteobacteria bacterium]
MQTPGRKSPTKKLATSTSRKAADGKRATTQTKAKRVPKTPQPEKSAKPRSNRAATVITETLGAHIKALRIERGLSQEQLGGLAELDRSAISMIERGRANPTLLTLSVLSSVFDRSLSQLLASVTANMNLKPTWKDPKAPLRRANRATPERIDTATARRLR